MSKKFLRPPAAFGDDDSDSDEDDRNANLSSDEEDDEEDDDNDDEQQVQEEEEEEEEESRGEERPKKRKASGGGNARKKTKASSFFELEAEDDDDDEEEDHGRRHRGDADGERMDAEAREIMLQQDRRRAQAGTLFTHRTAEEMAQDIDKRYRMQNRTVNRVAVDQRPRGSTSTGGGTARISRRREEEEDMEEGGPDAYGAVSQQSLLPSVQDTSYWRFECLTGKEHVLALQLMNKAKAYARQGKPLGITGVVVGQTKGTIYVESFSEPAVMEAIANIRGIWQNKKQIVPIDNMTTVLKVLPTKKPVKKNDWVRLTRGHYKGDLGVVREVRDSGLKCIVQCLPRLDLTLSELPPEERSRRKAIRPPQKFFSSQEVIARGKHDVGRQRFPALGKMCDFFEGNYFEDGYLLKEMTVGNMVKPCTQADGNMPTMEELQKFRRPKSGGEEDEEEEENAGSKLAGSLLDQLSSLQEATGLDDKGSGEGLQIGDTVQVVGGDLDGMVGKLTKENDISFMVQPLVNAELDEIEFLKYQLRKYIREGAHVKVLDGRYANETGTVVAIKDTDGVSTAIVMTDITNHEIEIHTAQLRETTEIATNQDKLEGYELYDLVTMAGGGSVNEVGVIVRVGREDFTIVNNHNLAREARPEELRGKLNMSSSKNSALDNRSQEIRSGDTVTVVDGPHKGLTATIKRLNKGQLWLHSQMRKEHAGIFAIRSRSCVLTGSGNSTGGRRNDAGVSPFSTPNSYAAQGAARGRAKRDDALMGKTVRIQAGQWKGYIGTVADTTATHVQVELHTRLKKVLVAHERVSVVGDRFGATEDPSRIITVPTVAGIAPTTPFIAAGQTPMHGGATPMHGGSLEEDGNDDVWRPGGSIDQEPDVKEEKGWGSSSPTTDDGDTWGASNADSEWGKPPPSKGVSDVKPTIKQEHQLDTDLAETAEIPTWFMERVAVEIQSSKRRGVIRQTQNSTAVVEFENGGTENVSVHDLTMVTPVEHDSVLVTAGNEIGLEGSLVCIDGTDAILKVDNDDFKIVDVSYLAKVVSS
jgi:transcription elongation factor SPT5